MLRHFIYILLGAGLMACSSVSEIQVGAQYIPIDNVSYSAKIDSIVNDMEDASISLMDLLIRNKK